MLFDVPIEVSASLNMYSLGLTVASNTCCCTPQRLNRSRCPGTVPVRHSCEHYRLSKIVLEVDRRIHTGHVVGLAVDEPGNLPERA